MSHCDLCDEFIEGRKNAYAERYGSRARRILPLTSKRLSLVPSLGQIVEGHLLIVPVAHYCALADMPGDAVIELDVVAKRARTALQAYGEKCVLFEHGARTSGSGGCGIDHGHMHVIPVAAEGVLEKLKQEFAGFRINSLSEVKSTIPERTPYLYFENAPDQRFVFRVPKLPSQYMRKLVAESIGKADWDWRKCGYEPELISTIHRLSPILSCVPTLSGL